MIAEHADGRRLQGVPGRAAVVAVGMRALHRAGVQTWGTKSFEFWTLLVAALGIVRPRALLELGSGRSTQYLAEYALKEKVPFVSVEQSRAWRRRVQHGLHAGLVGGSFVHRVPVAADGWYDVERLDRVVTFECDGVYVDGPVGAREGVGRAARGGARAAAWLAAKAPAPRLLVVDDVDRPENLELFDTLTTPSRLERFFLSYRPGPHQENVVAIAYPADAATRIRQVCEAAGIPLTADRPGAC